MTSLDCPELAGVRVLVVDDDEDSRELYATVLASHGAVVTMAATAGEAFAAFEREAPRIVLSDIGLPEEDGFSLMRKIRATDAHRGAPILAIALSGYDRDPARETPEDGFDLHFTKPVPLPKLISALRKFLAP